MNTYRKYPHLTAWFSGSNIVVSATMDLGLWITDYRNGDEFVVVGQYGDDREAAERHAEALYLAGVWYDGDKDEPTGAT